MNFNRIILFLVIVMIIVACSSSKDTSDTSQSTNQEIYVFDDVSEYENLEGEILEEEIITNNSVVKDSARKFVVQVGAFSTEERASRFIIVNQPKLFYNMGIYYSSEVNLYVVQLPPFNSRKEAESVRNELWKTEVFKDAFITTK